MRGVSIASPPDTELTPEDDTLALLRQGRIDVKGRLPWSSNMTYLAAVARPGGEMLAVYKPTAGERPLWDFPPGTLARREVAAYTVNRALEWKLVPPTVFRDGPMGAGAVQAFVSHDPEEHFLSLPSALRRSTAVRQLVAFDVVVNNADRKSGHVLVDDMGRLWAIDHGLTFHREPKLRTVIWEFAGEDLPADVVRDLRRLSDVLAQNGPARAALGEHLSEAEMAAMVRRIDALLATGIYPDMDPTRRDVPWPPV